MPYSILCEEPEVTPCPIRFRAKASSWIDASNIGDTSLRTPPPAGVRLRWSTPFLSPDATTRDGRPVRYEIERSGPLDPASLWLPSATAGHVPRTPMPRALWVPLDRQDDLKFSVPGARCRGVDAIYFEVPAGHPRVGVTLITTDGVSEVTGNVEGGDSFYFELADVKSVLFSGTHAVIKVEGLLLGAGDKIRVEYRRIATVDAERWLTEPLAVMGERLANSNGDLFITLDAASWAVLQNAGIAVRDALNDGRSLPEEAMNALSIAGAVRWEAATLIGWGFIDGEHPAKTTVDTIETGEMLREAHDSVYAYRVTAVLDRGEEEARISSVPCFTRTTLAPPLAAADCRPRQMPVARSRMTNFIDAGLTPARPIKTAPPEMRVFCSTSWEIESQLPATELIFTRPVADDSALTAKAFDDAGEFATGSTSGPLQFRRLDYILRRDLDFEIPYFDSDVGLELACADSWDRRKQIAPIPRVQPLIEYDGSCISIDNARCDGQLGTDGRAKVTLDLNQTMDWKADPLAAGGSGNILLLMKDPDQTQFQADVQIGPPFPTADNLWATEIPPPCSSLSSPAWLAGHSR